MTLQFRIPGPAFADRVSGCRRQRSQTQDYAYEKKITMEDEGRLAVEAQYCPSCSPNADKVLEAVVVQHRPICSSLHYKLLHITFRTLSSQHVLLITLLLILGTLLILPGPKIVLYSFVYWTNQMLDDSQLNVMVPMIVG